MCINPDQPKYVSTRYLAKNPFFLSKFYLEFLSVFFLSKIALFLSLHFGKKRYATQHPPRREARVGRPQGVGDSFASAYACPGQPRID